MKVTLFLFSLTLLTGFWPRVDCQAQDRSQSGKEAVRALEKQRTEAVIAKNYAVLEAILADELVYVHSDGKIDSKATYVQAMKDRDVRYISIETEAMDIRLYGKTAIINGVYATNNTKNTQTRLRFTNVYVRQKGQWQMVSWQSLKVAQ